MADDMHHSGHATAHVSTADVVVPAQLRAVSSAPLATDSLFAPVRHPVSTELLRLLTRVSDFLVAFVVVVAGLVLAYPDRTFVSLTLGETLPYFWLAAAGIIGLHAGDVYHHVKSRSFMDHVSRVVFLPGMMLGASVIVVRGFSANGTGTVLLLTATGLWLAQIAMHVHYKALLRVLQRSGTLARSAVIVGATENALRLIERNRETNDLRIVGIFDDRLERAPKQLGDVPVLGRLDDLLAWDGLPGIDRIVVTVTSEAKARVRTLVDRLRWLPNQVVLLLDLEGFNPEQQSLAEIASAPAAYVSGGPVDIRRAFSKRAADIVFSLGLIVLFAPVMLTCAALIRLDSKGPVFFRQRRHGFNNEIVRVWKFRTMRHDPTAELRMQAQTTANDPRVTRIGHWLRLTSLDELPQLFNVVIGDMSLVGPRPHAIGMTTEAIEVHDIVSDYAHRHRVKPGITGWAQIHGSRGPVHSRAEVRERVRLDLEYINRASFWLDVYIMLKTLPCLLGDTSRQR